MRNFTWCMAVPTINDEQDIRDFLATVPERHRSNLIFTDNTPTSVMKNIGGTFFVHYHPENAGIAKGWNYGLSAGMDYTILCSASVRFRDFDRFLEQIRLYANAFGLLTEEAWHLIVVGEETVVRCGLVDENFWPAYYEDNDYGHRWKLAGIHEVPWDQQGLANMPKVIPPAYSIDTARALKQGKIKPDTAALMRYYIEKWGGLPGQEVFQAPYNEDRELGYWRPR